MSLASHAYALLNRWYGIVLRNQRLSEAEAATPSWRRTPATVPVMEQLEPRLLLSGTGTEYEVNSHLDVIDPDDEVITLREAVEAASTNAVVGDAPKGDDEFTDIITFASNLWGETIQLGGPLVIAGDPAGLQISDFESAGVTVDANGRGCVLDISSGAVVTINNVIITGGLGSVFVGGGITNNGTLDLVNVTVSGNSGVCGGGVRNNGTLTLNNTMVAGNWAYGGGGIWNNTSASLTLNDSVVEVNWVYYEGGGIRNSGAVTLNNTTVEDNSANYDGGGIYNMGTLDLIDVTVEDNSASSGGGILNEGALTLTNAKVLGNSSSNTGGGIFNEGNLDLTNTVLSGNSAMYGGGILNYYNPITLTNTTVAGNSASRMGGGVFPINSGGTTTLNNSIVALNTANWGSPNVGGAYVSNFSLVSEVDPGFIRIPGFDGPDDYGDLHLAPGSIAIDAGSDALLPEDTHDLDGDDDITEPLPYDLDNQSRKINGTVNIGAYEFQGVSFEVNVSHDTTLLDEETTLREAIVAANGNGTSGEIYDRITFASDLFTAGQGTITLGGTTLGISESVVISVPAGKNMTIDANDGSGVFHISSGAEVSIAGMTITGGGGMYGHGIRNYGDLTLDYVTVSGNTAGYRGGGIRSESPGELTLRNSEVSGNTSGEMGGGIFAGGDLTLANVTVSGNTSDNKGGGIFGYGNMTLANVTVSDNSVNLDGGYDTRGGGILSDGDMMLVGGTVSGNRLSGNISYGGGILCNGDMTLTNVTVWDNKAQDGGGIQVSNLLTMIDSEVRDNEAFASGGGIRGSAVASLLLKNSTISNNTAGSEGGGIAASINGDLINTSVTNNTAGGDGGGISNDGTLTLTNTIVSGNKCSVNGGGIYNHWGSELTLTNTRVSGNLAAYGGGGIYNYKGEVTLNNTTVAGNFANYGGGLMHYVGSGSSLVLQNTLVALNHSKYGDLYGDHNINGPYNSADPFNLVTNTDPGFIDPPSPGDNDIWGDDDDVEGDLHLKATSEAVDSVGLNTLLPEDEHDLDDNGVFDEDIPYDLDNWSRVVGGTVDLGAYEYQN